VSVEQPHLSRSDRESANDETQAAEIERLRARVAQLEAELVEVEEWANRAVATAQERVYWLDRWHLDLNRLMERRGAAELRAVVRAMRAVYRRLNQIRRRLRA
jgi:hypothetical protein